MYIGYRYHREMNVHEDICCTLQLFLVTLIFVSSIKVQAYPLSFKGLQSKSSAVLPTSNLTATPNQVYLPQNTTSLSLKMHDGKVITSFFPRGKKHEIAPSNPLTNYRDKNILSSSSSSSASTGRGFFSLRPRTNNGSSSGEDESERNAKYNFTHRQSYQQALGIVLDMD